ncbi:hypothetical protein B296_00000814 [Ensete ventricosum]|uniref:Uncharacterized protein n=1 Tax=Ensete ventricosum TaxID=4639 RepID=A0A427A3V4_ENSVE|nr:hypothetical protein B296_00000814 [Ensete ventricosum]
MPVSYHTEQSSVCRYAFEDRIEDKLRALFHKFKTGRSESPNKSQRGESFDYKENRSEKCDQGQDTEYLRMRVEFLRWEDGDPTSWISRAERFFRSTRPQKDLRLTSLPYNSKRTQFGGTIGSSIHTAYSCGSNSKAGC